MKEYERTFGLRQHTPMLHFQHNMPGATLRATEVKPKLDRYLKGISGGKANMDPAWFVKDSGALAYKLRFSAKGECVVSNTGETAIDNRRTGQKNRPSRPIVGSYFGNMVSAKGLTPAQYEAAVRNNYKETVRYSLPIEMTVVCFIPELMALIENNIAAFFYTQNFGTRQSKGFGSFTLVDDTATDVRIAAILREHYQAETCYMFSAAQPLQAIQNLYAEIKSGIPGSKKESLLFAYMRSLSASNEKLYLKNTPPYSWKNVPPERALYIRALLGVGDQLKVKQRGADRPFDVQVKNTDIDPGTDKPVIERFPSPIFFKVVGKKIFFVGKRLEQDIFDKSFAFSSRSGTAVIRTPSAEQTGTHFMDDFLDYCFRDVHQRLKMTAFTQEET